MIYDTGAKLLAVEGQYVIRSSYPPAMAIEASVSLGFYPNSAVFRAHGGTIYLIGGESPIRIYSVTVSPLAATLLHTVNTSGRFYGRSGKYVTELGPGGAYRYIDIETGVLGTAAYSFVTWDDEPIATEDGTWFVAKGNMLYRASYGTGGQIASFDPYCAIPQVNDYYNAPDMYTWATWTQFCRVPTRTVRRYGMSDTGMRLIVDVEEFYPDAAQMVTRV